VRMPAMAWRTGKAELKDSATMSALAVRAEVRMSAATQLPIQSWMDAGGSPE